MVHVLALVQVFVATTTPASVTCSIDSEFTRDGTGADPCVVWVMEAVTDFVTTAGATGGIGAAGSPNVTARGSLPAGKEFTTQVVSESFVTTDRVHVRPGPETLNGITDLTAI